MVFQIKVEQKRGFKWISFQGLLSNNDYPRINALVKQILNKRTRFVFDFSKLEAFDRDGLNEITNLVFTANHMGSIVYFTGINSTMAEHFKRLGVFDIMEFSNGESHQQEKKSFERNPFK